VVGSARFSLLTISGIRAGVTGLSSARSKISALALLVLITMPTFFAPTMGGVAGANQTAKQGQSEMSAKTPANSTYVRITGRLATLFGRTARYYLKDDLGLIELIIDAGAGDLYRYEGMTIQVSGYLVSQDNRLTLYVEKWTPLEAAPLGAVSGTRSAVVILVEFSDNTASHTVNYFQQLIFGQMNAYYVEVSYNSIQITGSVTIQWYKLSRPTTYYPIDTWEKAHNGWAIYRQLASDVIALVDPYVNFAAYQHYVMVFAGDWVWGARCSGLAIATNDGVTVNSATFLRETYGMTVHAHEFGHELGLPDLYDYDFQDPYGFVDGWDLMGNDTTQHLSSWSKIQLGWIPTSRIRTFTTGAVTETIDRIEYSTSGCQALKVLTSTNIYFLVETRQKVGYDLNLPASAPDHGVLITVIDETRASGHGIVRLVDANPTTKSNWDGDAVWQAGQTYTNTTYVFSISIQSWTGTGFTVTVSSQFEVRLQSREDDGASSNKGLINSYSLPTTILKAAGSYSATYSPEAGYWFVRWETSGGVSVSSATSQSTTVTVSSSGTLRAIYANPFSPLTVALISPSSGAVVSSSPVELKVRVTSGGSAVQDTTVMFYVDGSVLPTSSTSDSNGYATRAYLPPSAKSYSWYATAEKYQYDRGTSPTWTFTFSPDLRGTLQHFDLDYRGVPPSSDGDDQISITVNAGSTLTLFFYYKEGSAGNPYIIRVYLEWDKSRVIARSNNGGTDPETGWEVGGFRWGKGDYTVPSTGGTYKARVVYTGSQTPPTWDSYDRLLAEGTITVLPVTTITIASTPSGSGFVKVDGATITTPWTFTWTVGSTHTLEALSPVTGGSGIQYIWVSWSDGAAQLHSYSVPSSSQTVAANYKTQYYLTLQVNPTAGGTVSPSSRWCDAGSVIPIQATASSGYLFSSWLGSGTGSYTGSLNPTTVSMNGPITETANFARAGALQYFDLDYRGTPPSSDGNDQQSVSVGAGSTLTLFFYYREGDAGNYYIIRVFPEWNKGLVIAKSDNHGTVIEDTGREIGGFRWDYGSYTVPSAPRTYRVRVVYRASQTPPTWDSYDRLLAEGTVTVLPIVTVATTTTETTSATLTSSTTASVTTSSLSTTTTTMASSSTSYQTTTSTRYSGSTSTSYTTRTTLLSTSTTLSTTILTSAGTSTLATTELSKTGTTTVSESLTSITTSGDTLYVNIKVRQTVIEQFLKKIMSTIVQWFSELSRIVQNLFVTETVRETVVRIEPLSAERGTCRIVLDASPKPGYVGKPVRIIGVMYGSWRCIRDGMVVGKPVEITAGWGFRAVVVTNDRGEFSIDTTAPSTVYSPPVPYLITAAFYEDQDLTGTSATITYQIIAKTPTTITISYVGNREFAGYLRRTDTGEYLAYKPVKLTVTYVSGGTWQTTTYNLQTRQDGYWTLEFLFYWSSATITFEGDETYASSTATITRSGSAPPGGGSTPPRASSAMTEASCRFTLDASPKPGYVNMPVNISGVMYGSWRCIRDGMVVGKPVEVVTGWGFSATLTTDYYGRFSAITNCPSQGGTYPITATFYEDQDLTASSTTISYEVIAKIPTTITISYVGNREFGGYLRRADTGAYLAYKPVKLTVTYLSGTAWRTDSFDLQTRHDGYYSLEFLFYWNSATISFEGDETYASSQATITR